MKGILESTIVMDIVKATASKNNYFRATGDFYLTLKLNLVKYCKA